ncbi:MAG: LemA family protein [Burkholderiaceae bacterium]
MVLLSVSVRPSGVAMTLLRALTRSRFFALLGALWLATSLTGCGYNDFQRLDESSKAAWSEVLNQYQRRADLIPNLVAAIKGAIDAEQDILAQVVEARSKATAIQVSPDMVNDPQAMQQFQAAQGQLGSSLSRLLAVVEQYPQLKSIDQVRDLTTALEGTENRIAVARNRYIQTVQDYNVLTRSFPTNLTAMVFSYSPKAGFQVEDEAALAKPPAVNLSRP